MLFFTLNREDFSFVIHLDRQPRTSRRREAQTGSRARSGSRSERTLDAVEHSRTLMEWWPFLIFHRGGLRIKVINNNAQPDLNARTDTERAMRGLILVAVGAASLAAGGFIALRRAHVERARSGRVTVPTVIAAFVAYLGPSVCSLLASWWSAWLLPLPRGLAYPVLCQNSALFEIGHKSAT